MKTPLEWFYHALASPYGMALLNTCFELLLISGILITGYVLVGFAIASILDLFRPIKDL